MEWNTSAVMRVAYNRSPSLSQRAKTVTAEFVVDGDNQYRVELLVREIFARSCIRSVVIQKNVRFLPDKSFEFCQNLCEACFSPGNKVRVWNLLLQSLGGESFGSCRNLFSLRFEEAGNLRCTGKKCFDGCKVTGLLIPTKAASVAV